MIFTIPVVLYSLAACSLAANDDGMPVEHVHKPIGHLASSCSDCGANWCVDVHEHMSAEEYGERFDPGQDLFEWGCDKALGGVAYTIKVEFKGTYVVVAVEEPVLRCPEGWSLVDGTCYSEARTFLGYRSCQHSDCGLIADRCAESMTGGRVATKEELLTWLETNTPPKSHGVTSTTSDGHDHWLIESWTNKQYWYPSGCCKYENRYHVCTAPAERVGGVIDTSVSANDLLAFDFRTLSESGKSCLGWNEQTSVYLGAYEDADFHETICSDLGSGEKQCVVEGGALETCVDSCLSQVACKQLAETMGLSLGFKPADGYENNVDRRRDVSEEVEILFASDDHEIKGCHYYAQFGVALYGTVDGGDVSSHLQLTTADSQHVQRLDTCAGAVERMVNPEGRTHLRILHHVPLFTKQKQCEETVRLNQIEVSKAELEEKYILDKQNLYTWGCHNFKDDSIIVKVGEHENYALELKEYSRVGEGKHCVEEKVELASPLTNSADDVEKCARLALADHTCNGIHFEIHGQRCQCVVRGSECTVEEAEGTVLYTFLTRRDPYSVASPVGGRDLREHYYKLPQRQEDTAWVKVDLPANLAEDCAEFLAGHHDWLWLSTTTNSDIAGIVTGFVGNVYDTCVKPLGLPESTITVTKLRNDTTVIGSFKQPPTPAEDGLNKAAVRDSACQDGDLTTTCEGPCKDTDSTTACQGQEIELEEPLMLMRVVLGSPHLYADKEESFDVLAYDGARWSACSKAHVWIAKQWTRVDCVNSVYAEKIKIVGATREISEIHPTGALVSTLASRSSSGTEFEQSTCVHQSTSDTCNKLSGCRWQGQEQLCIGENSADWPVYAGLMTCNEDAVIEEIECAQGDTSDLCSGNKARRKHCRSLGPACWGYTVMTGKPDTVKFLSAGASDTFECAEAMGLRSHDHDKFHNHVTYKRPYIRAVDLLNVEGPCFEYRMANGILKTTYCSKDEQMYAETVKFELDGVRDCGVKYGYDHTQSRTCTMSRAFRRNMGQELFTVFEDLRPKAAVCIEDSRRRSSDFENAMRAPAQQSGCWREAQKSKSYQCKNLQLRLKIKADIDELQDTIDKLTKKEISRQKAYGIATTILDGTAGAIGTVGAGIDGFWASPAIMKGDYVDKARRESRRRRSSSELESSGLASFTDRDIFSNLKRYAPVTAAVAPKGRRRAMILTIILVVAGLISTVSGIVGGISDAMAQDYELEVLRIQSQIDAVDAKIEEFENDAALAELCAQPTEQETQCMIEDLGEELKYNIERIDQSISSGFSKTMAMMHQDHVNQMKALYKMNWNIQLLRDETWTVEQAINRVEERLRKMDKKDELHSKALEVAQHLRMHREMMVADNGVEQFETFKKEGWCRFLEISGGYDAMLSMVNWISSDEFLEESKPIPTRASTEQDRELTKCELVEWRVEYSEDYKATKALFEFAAWIRMYYIEFDDTALKVIEDQRTHMHETFLSNLEKIETIETDAIRCIHDEVTCKPGFHVGDSTRVMSDPCDMNTCSCPHGAELGLGQGVTDERCITLDTVGCKETAIKPLGFHFEVQDNGLLRFAPDQPTCTRGHPVTLDYERDGYHGKEKCKSCDEGAYLEDDLCHENQCTCVTAYPGADNRMAPKLINSYHAIDGETYEYLHEGLCAEGWMEPDHFKIFAVEDCYMKCDETPGCGYFSYSDSLDHCVLFYSDDMGFTCAEDTSTQATNKHPPAHKTYRMILQGVATKGAMCPDNRRKTAKTEKQYDFCNTCKQPHHYVNLRPYFTTTEGKNGRSLNAKDTFDQGPSGYAKWEAVLDLPTLVDSDFPQLQMVWIPDDCFNGCPENTFTVTISAQKPSGELESVLRHEFKQHATKKAAYTAKWVSLRGAASSRFRITLEAESQVGDVLNAEFLRSILRLYFHSPGDEPMEYLSSDDQPSRVCKLWATPAGLMDTAAAEKEELVKITDFHPAMLRVAHSWGGLVHGAELKWNDFLQGDDSKVVRTKAHPLCTNPPEQKYSTTCGQNSSNGIDFDDANFVLADECASCMKVTVTQCPPGYFSQKKYPGNWLYSESHLCCRKHACIIH